ncbi:MAG: CHASE3 domain-containing protein [Verrucomicrobiales bacterium]|nr:CHASE3 domain-containing protein [Verrucomicrobiales bacterium]
MHRSPNNLVYRTVVILWITLTSASVILSGLAWSDLAKSLTAAREAVEIRDELDEILRLLLDVETAQRGFAITGDETFLDPFHAAEKQLPSRFEVFLERAKPDLNWFKAAVDLRAKAEVMLTFHREAVEVRRHQGVGEAARLVATRRGKRAMDEVRVAIHRLRLLKGGGLVREGLTPHSQLRRASLTSLAAGGLGVCAGIYAFWLARIMLGHQERERKLVEAKLEAERSSREKTVFLANMSHEIRTPMNAILGFSELLAGEVKDTRHREFLQAIRTSAGSLLQLINDILDMSKIEAGVMELRLEPTDPREICDFLHTMFGQHAAKKGVRLECVVAEDLPRALLMDRVRLRQTLVNLVGNAVKFTDQGSIWVRVQWEKQEDSSHITLLIEVEDTGVGIPAEKLEAIFRPFVQAGAHRDKEKTGTGLGLSIVQRLTNMMGGTVTVASVPGKGSAFSLRFKDLPVSVRLAQGEKLDGAPEVVDFETLRPSTLLVVDDNEANCQLVLGMFAGTSHKLEVSLNGEDAVEMCRTLMPDVILMDVRMPGMGGRETLAEIRKIPGMELRPVIAVTASSLLSDDADLKQRFSGYVRKPFSKHDLFVELAQFIPLRQATAEGGAFVLAGGGADAPDPAKASPVPQELLAALAELEIGEWPGLRDRMAINEIRGFAARLIGLGQQWECSVLVEYAETLDQGAAAYAVSEVEQHLSAFPALTSRLREASA